jgi:hypothetical protein
MGFAGYRWRMPKDPTSKDPKPGASKDSEDFDLASLFVGPANIMTGVLGLADNGRKTVAGVMETIASLQRAAKALESLVVRLDAVVAEIEAPMKALAPELERATARLVRISEAFEGPLDRLIPGLEGAISSLDRVSISQLPDTLESVQRQVSSLLDVIRDIPTGFALMGDLASRVGLSKAKPTAQSSAPKSSAPKSSVAKSTAKTKRSSTAS